MLKFINKLMDNSKDFIRQRIEELIKGHDIRHLKKKFKRDIEKLEVIKIQFCDIYKNGIYSYIFSHII